MKRVVVKEWKYKVDNYDRQRALMTGFINRMMKSYLQKGWVTWEYYDKGAVAFKAKRRTIYLQKSITTLGDQVSRLDDILKAQLEEVEVMRQCVETQIKCSERVCAGREAVADALPEAIDLCEEDLEPQIEALAADKLDDYDPGLDGRVSKYGPRRPHRRASAPEARERQRLFDHSPESACRVFRRRNEELVAANQVLESANEKLREDNEKLRVENAKLRDYMNNRFI